MNKRYRYFFIECDELSDHGYNKALKVFLMVPGKYPEFVGANYAMDSRGWAGYRVEARKLVAKLCGHKLPNPYQDFPAKSVTLEGLY